MTIMDKKRNPADTEGLVLDERYSLNEMEELYQKAKELALKYTPKPCPQLVRDKDQNYFEKECKNGIMEPYEKDNHGDPRNPINLNIDGLFFNPPISPNFSIYGSMRFTIDPLYMITLAPKLYFSDVYCVNSSNNPHYIQLVLTKPGSQADVFCQNHLVELDITDNPFFFIKDGSVCVRRSTKLSVEILFTEALNLNIFPKPTIIQNKSCQRKFTRKISRKNADCFICNIETPRPKCVVSDDSEKKTLEQLMSLCQEALALALTRYS